MSAKRVDRQAVEDPVVPVLCGCGWGSLGMKESEVPEFCPVCGFDLWAYAERE